MINFELFAALLCSSKIVHNRSVPTRHLTEKAHVEGTYIRLGDLKGPQLLVADRLFFDHPEVDLSSKILMNF